MTVQYPITQSPPLVKYYLEKLFQGEPGYSFNYSILDEETGVTHSRDESSDEKGVIRGSYEVSQPGEVKENEIFLNFSLTGLWVVVISP